MNYKSTAFLLLLSLSFQACSDSKKELSEATKVQKTEVKISQKVVQKEATKLPPKKNYTLKEIYESQCIMCHLSHGEGTSEKLTPSMTHKSQSNIEKALLEIENGNGHVIMQYNRGEISKMGMHYTAEDMAEYMFKRFNNN